MQQNKGLFWHYISKENILPKISFKNLVPKESFAPKGTFSIKLIGVYIICNYSDLFLACKLYSSGPQITPLISDHLRFMASVDIGGF